MRFLGPRAHWQCRGLEIPPCVWGAAGRRSGQCGDGPTLREQRGHPHEPGLLPRRVLFKCADSWICSVSLMCWGRHRTGQLERWLTVLTRRSSTGSTSAKRQTRGQQSPWGGTLRGRRAGTPDSARGWGARQRAPGSVDGWSYPEFEEQALGYREGSAWGPRVRQATPPTGLCPFRSRLGSRSHGVRCWWLLLTARSLGSELHEGRNFNSLGCCLFSGAGASTGTFLTVSV